MSDKRQSRWFAALMGDAATGGSAAYAALVAEQERGWTSPAIAAWYGDKAPPPTTTSSKQEDQGPTPSPPASAGPSTGSGTVFVASAGVDLDSLCDRYRSHAEGILPLGNPDRFALSGAPTGSGATGAKTGTGAVGTWRGRGAKDWVRAPRPALRLAPGASPVSFLDLGSAPGGVSLALLRANDRFQAPVGAPLGDALVRCVSVTLGPAEGGIAMAPGMLREVAQWAATGPTAATPTPLSSLRHAVVYCSVTDGPAMDAGISAAVRTPNDVTVSGSTAGSGPVLFDFVNAGVVADFGQREAQAALRTAQTDRDGPLPPPPSVPVPWFELFAPQLLAALRHLRPGGDLMVVFGPSDSSSLLLVLRLLAPMLRPHSGVAVLPTIHPTKPPVYVYLRGVFPTAATIAHVVAELFVIPPHDESDQGVLGSSTDGLSGAEAQRQAQWARYEALAAYWRGDTDCAHHAAVDVWTHGVPVEVSGSAEDEGQRGGDVASHRVHRIPVREALETLWRSRAQTLRDKHDRIERQAAQPSAHKRPREP